MFRHIGLTERETAAALRQLWRFRQANRQALQDIFTAEGGTLRGLLAGVTDQVAEVASQLAPWLTGTLASAHRGRLEESQSQLAGVVYIDPAVVNPVFGGYAAVYGAEVHQEQPWFAWTVLAVQEQVLTHLTAGIRIRLEELYDG